MRNFTKRDSHFIHRLKTYASAWAVMWTSERERSTTEATLRKNEELFRAIATTARDAVILMDGEGRISYWNPAAEEIFGYSAAEVSGKPQIQRSRLKP